MTPQRSLPTLASGLGALALLGTLTACGGTDTTAAVHQVQAGDHSCKVDDTALAAGRHAFQIENVGSDVTEVYVYRKDGDDFSKIMGEKENIGPGTSQTLQVDLSAGDYQVACKPGMTGDGIRTALTVTGSGGSTDAAAQSYDRELSFVVSPSGTLQRPEQRSATTGERIEFVLANHSDQEYYLELISPDGTEVGEGEAPAGEEAEFVSELTDSGDYHVRVFRDGHDSDATTIPFTVTR